MECSIPSTRKQIQKMQGHATGSFIITSYTMLLHQYSSGGHRVGYKSSLLFLFWPYTFTYKAVQTQAVSVGQ